MATKYPLPVDTLRCVRLRVINAAAVIVFWLALGLPPIARADVLINEFLADNEGGLRTAAGE